MYEVLSPILGSRDCDHRKDNGQWEDKIYYGFSSSKVPRDFLSVFREKGFHPLYEGRKRVGFLFLFSLSDGKHVHERTGRPRSIQGSMIFFVGLVRITRNG